MISSSLLNQKLQFLKNFHLKIVVTKKQLKAFKHKGFWYSIDTKRDKENLESLIKNKKSLGQLLNN